MSSSPVPPMLGAFGGSDLRARRSSPAPGPTSDAGVSDAPQRVGSSTQPDYYHHTSTPRSSRLERDDVHERSDLSMSTSDAAMKGHYSYRAGSNSLNPNPSLPGINISHREAKLILALTVLAGFVRLYRISEPSSVVFDEVHFGGYAGKYIKTKYFMDVHPPLAKLLITLAGWLFGYRGTFDFKDIGKDYLESGVPYVAMRMLPALLGIAVVPIAFLTMRFLHCRTTTAALASLLVTFDNALVTQSRLILLDSPLVFFTAATVCSWSAFINLDRRPADQFKKSWWFWLTLTGLCLGATVSCKWVGLFTIATIGVAVLLQLWNLLGDLRLPPKALVRHFAARVICLILVPTLFYMSMFGIHFSILNTTGDGDAFMSSEFQHTLSGRHMPDTMADVSLGSSITLRHFATSGGYVHSHPHNYPSGSNQQQVTLYPHKDDNNIFRIHNVSEEGVPEYDYMNKPIVHVTDGMVIRLEHVMTQKRLHSHDVRAPISDADYQNEVSVYGFPGFEGDANDHWKVEIEYGDSSDSMSSKRLKPIRTKFRLRHLYRACYLFSHKVKLPAWGFEQQEVTCNQNPKRENSIWYIETNEHSALPATAEKVNYPRPSFLSKFLELQAVMWRTNNGLKSRHAYDSRPESWPLLRRGINFWVKDHRQVYLIGNPVIWWSSTLAVVLYIAARGILVLRAQRGFKDLNHSFISFYEGIGTFLTVGWALHYLPFFLMQRQLFIHHYLPALYFAILMLCVIFDCITTSLKPMFRVQAAALLVILVLWSFFHFASLAYALPWTRTQCEKAKFLKTWDFDCVSFYERYDNYAQAGPAIKAPQAADELIIGEKHRQARPVVGEKGFVVDENDKAAETTGLTTEGLEPAQNPFEQTVEEAEVTSALEQKQDIGPEEAHTTSIQADALAGHQAGDAAGADEALKLAKIDDAALKQGVAGIPENAQATDDKVVAAVEKLENIHPDTTADTAETSSLSAEPASSELSV